MDMTLSKLFKLLYLCLLSFSFFCSGYAKDVTIRYVIENEVNTKDQTSSTVRVYGDVYLNGKLCIKNGTIIYASFEYTKAFITDPAKIKVKFNAVYDVYGNRLDLKRSSCEPTDSWGFLGGYAVFTGYPKCTIEAGTVGTIDYDYPYYGKYFANTPTTQYDENAAKTLIEKQKDEVVGIYEAVNLNGFKLACLKDEDTYKLIFLSSTKDFVNNNWRTGDVKAILRSSAERGIFKSDEWYLDDKSVVKNVYIFFDGGSMKIQMGVKEYLFLKMYPTAGTATHSGEWGGTGFALNSGYVVTNHHVIDGAHDIEIYGVKGDFNTPYTATVIASDKNSDLALLKISDSRFPGFGTIPYKIKTTQSEVGESISVLGYPLTSTMGDEIKLTTGVISSKTGFQGDVSLYQISAAVQPGNSGGPLFDNYGNIIGIVSSKHTGAENVGYAVKATYLRNLVESCVSTSILPTNTSLSGLTLPEKVKKSKNFIFMIRCK